MTTIDIAPLVPKTYETAFVLNDSTNIITTGIPYDSWQFFLYLPVTAEIILLSVNGQLYNTIPRGVYRMALRYENGALSIRVYQIIEGPSQVRDEFPVGTNECETAVFAISVALIGGLSTILGAGILGGPTIIVGIIFAATGFGIAIGVALIIFGVLLAFVGGIGTGGTIGLGLASLLARELQPILCG